MGLFSALKTRYKMSEAAVVVQNLLEIQVKEGNFDHDPASFANKLVSEIWDQKPDVFNGKFGQRPHKIIVAAIALANGIDQFQENDYNRLPMVVSLGKILSAIELNGRLFPLNSLDHQLLETVVSSFEKIVNDDT